MDIEVNNEDALMAVLWTLAIFLLPGVPDLAHMVLFLTKKRISFSSFGHQLFGLPLIETT